ncbi:hypothetical protein Gogos_013326 [Gossypium gossypioides]|uniref:DUF7138 domain-containing protein n=1 Tax=Gossypium gossypioides TaxID=34282 RepID=A0A7J9BVB8_GOSGO|nr:hypothetical protein [Gossypium gossypioides]
MVEAAAVGGVVAGGGVPFPVVFFDGECETGIGNVVIHPAMDFKAFQSILSRGGGGSELVEARVCTGLDEFERRVRDLQMEKERYLVNLGSANLRIARESKSLVCEECEKAKVVGTDIDFHWCVYDAVTFGFRSHAGPIARPAKGSGY